METQVITAGVGLGETSTTTALESSVFQEQSGT